MGPRCAGAGAFHATCTCPGLNGWIKAPAWLGHAGALGLFIVRLSPGAFTGSRRSTRRWRRRSSGSVLVSAMKSVCAARSNLGGEAKPGARSGEAPAAAHECRRARPRVCTYTMLGFGPPGLPFAGWVGILSGRIRQSACHAHVEVWVPRWPGQTRLLEGRASVVRWSLVGRSLI